MLKVEKHCHRMISIGSTWNSTHRSTWIMNLPCWEVTCRPWTHLSSCHSFSPFPLFSWPVCWQSSSLAWLLSSHPLSGLSAKEVAGLWPLWHLFPSAGLGHPFPLFSWLLWNVISVWVMTMSLPSSQFIHSQSQEPEHGRHDIPTQKCMETKSP